MGAVSINSLLGGRRALKATIKSDLDLIDLADQGIPLSAWESLVAYMGWTRDFAAELLPVSRRTAARWKAGITLSSEVSDQVLSLARVVARGVEVFGSKDKFLRWLTQPSIPLGGRAPQELLGHRIGQEMVRDELYRIDYGEYV